MPSRFADWFMRWAKRARLLRPKAVASAYERGPWKSVATIGALGSRCEPGPVALLAELKNSAWTCATINASVCASYPPRLYVATHERQAAPRCLCKNLEARAERRLRALPTLPPLVAKAAQVQEVLDHPLLTLLQQVNPVHNAFDLLELTTLYQEVHGSAYWLLQFGSLGAPAQIWILPSHLVTPRRVPDSPRIVDGYEYRGGGAIQVFRPEEIIHFRYPDPRDPYTAGLGPLRACWEQVALTSDYAALKKALYENHALPSAIVSPDEVIGEEERDRLESQWKAKFRRGGNGQVVVAESGLRVQLLHQAMGDLSALADMKATKEDICNAFHVPLSFLSSETNLANLQADEQQHASKAILPRLRRRDQKLNEQLVPLFDPSGRLFLASDDPVKVNVQERLKEEELFLRFGVLSINEVRQANGLAPAPWGEAPHRSRAKKD